MDNPFENVDVEVQRKPRVKKNLKLSQLFELFPEESVNSVIVKGEIAEKIKESNLDFSNFKLFKITQLMFNKYYYNIKFTNEQELDNVISMIKEFEMFKTN